MITHAEFVEMVREVRNKLASAHWEVGEPKVTGSRVTVKTIHGTLAFIPWRDQFVAISIGPDEQVTVTARTDVMYLVAGAMVRGDL